jgi:hypothetical protein
MKSPGNKAFLMRQTGGDILAVTPQIKNGGKGKTPTPITIFNLNCMPQFNIFFMNLNFLNLGLASLCWPLKNESQLLKYLKCKVPFLLIILLPLFIQSQNLVPNPSFEEYLECPYSTAELHNQVIDWFSWQGTPDYFNVCSNELEAFAGVPTNSFGNQNPILGDAYSALLNYTHSFVNDREYMACALLESFEVNQSYYVMFYASFYEGGVLSNYQCAINKLGVKFFKDPPQYTPEVWDNPYTPQNTADIEYSEMFVDSTNWVLIEGWFEADQAYNWMAIGNFYDDDHTDTLQLGEPNKCYAIYFIENVCIAKNASDCDYLKQPADINSVESENTVTFQVFPNPGVDEFQVNFSIVPEEIEVFNAIGQSIYLPNVTSNSITINSTHWAKGLYILVVKGGGGNHQTFKLIKQ